MRWRLAIVCIGIITGIFLASSARVEVVPPKIAELEEFRALLATMVQIALPESDFVYIAARESRFQSIWQDFADLKLPESLKPRQKDFDRAREYFMNVSRRFASVMTSSNHQKVAVRLLQVDTAFARMSVALGGPPPAVQEFATAADPLVGDKKHPPRVPPPPEEVAALRRAVENLLATKVGGDYALLRADFERERAMAAGAVRDLDSTIATRDSVRIRAAMRGVAASSRRLWTIFQPRKE